MTTLAGTTMMRSLVTEDLVVAALLRPAAALDIDNVVDVHAVRVQEGLADLRPDAEGKPSRVAGVDQPVHRRC
jgi:hypothetical protein